MKKEKLGYNQKMVGKTIRTEIDNQTVMALVESVINEETLIVRDFQTQESFEVSIFDVRGM
jgi:hypothetical protein